MLEALVSPVPTLYPSSSDKYIGVDDAAVAAVGNKLFTTLSLPPSVKQLLDPLITTDPVA
tara:strand:+ start:155 stop:334 length:180 start_codon:yes stop_codon:yes gene_type:complete